MRILIGINSLALILAIAGAAIMWGSHYRVAARYAEMERAGCINESALVEFSHGRFLPDQRQTIARWLIAPTLNMSLGICGLLAVCGLFNIVILTVVTIRRNTAGA